MEEFLWKEKYINPLSDFGFKRIFFNELDKELLINFLNEILGGQEKIKDVHYQPTIQLGETEADRKAIFDIFCTNEKDESIIVEMQKANQPYFEDRCLFYATFPIQKQAPQGVWDFQLKAVYMVAILDFVLFDEFEEDKQHYIERVDLLRRRTKTLYSKKLNFVFVELPKFTKNANELTTNVERWLFSLKNLSRLDSRPSEVQGAIFKKLFKAAEIKQLTPVEMETYRKSVLEYRDVRDAVDYAEEKGERRGIATGIEKGLSKGIEQEKIAIAKRCLQKKLPVSMIMELTGMTAEQIRQIPPTIIK